MDLGSLLIILALLILVGLFVSRPLFEPQSTSDDAGRDDSRVQNLQHEKDEHQISSLMAERDRVLSALQELDFDFTLGKIPEEDYPLQRQMLLENGAQILRQLNNYELQSQTVVTGGGDLQRQSLIAEQQLAVTGVVTADSWNGQRLPVSDDDEIEVLLANRRRERQGKASGFCHKCGAALQKVDKFCPKCGAKNS